MLCVSYSNNNYLIVSDDMKENDEKECSICLEHVPDNQFVILSCKHYFCDKCLIDNNTMKIDLCPLCRERILSIFMKNKTIKLSVPCKKCSKCKQSIPFVFSKCYVSSCTNELAETTNETRTYNVNITCIRSTGTFIAFPNNVPGCMCCHENFARIGFISNTNQAYCHVFPNSYMKTGSSSPLGKDKFLKKCNCISVSSDIHVNFRSA